MSYPLLDAFLTMVWFFLCILWFVLLFRVILDIFASHDLSGGGKAIWLVVVIVLPFLGVFVYIVARGRQMQEHQARSAREQDKAIRDYVRQTGGDGGSSADQLAKLADLRDRGAITDQEFQQAKSRVLAGQSS